MNAVPFSIANVFAGFGECTGLIRDEGTQLVLEFEIKDALVGLAKSGVKVVNIPVTAIASAKYKRGWIGGSIRIQATNLDAVKDVPCQEHGQLVLNIARKDREAAERFVNELYAKA